MAAPLGAGPELPGASLEDSSLLAALLLFSAKAPSLLLLLLPALLDAASLLLAKILCSMGPLSRGSVN